MSFLLLFVLAVKHWIADFVLQFEYMVVQKATYGLRGGLEHALLHGVFTAIVLLTFINNLAISVIFGVLDTVIHYHIDYVKARWGATNTSTHKFWVQMGADQLAHYTFYIWMVWILYEVI